MKNKHGLKMVLSIASIGIMFVGLYQFAFASTFGSFQSDRSTKMSNSSSIIEKAPNIVQTSAATKSEIAFTAAELALYDGMNGNPAYVAVDGIVYDMTKIGAWKNGQHQGLSAGQDLSAAFAGSPHSKNILDQSPIVGKLVTTKAPVTGNTPSTSTTTTSTTTVTKPQTWTLDALSKFNGMNGNPAYIAVSGTIYDVTKIGAWSGGEHRGIKAGQDVTTFFASSPHSASLLNQVPIVGKVGGTISTKLPVTVDTTTSATTSNSNSNSNDNAYDDEDYDDVFDDDDEDEDDDEYDDDGKDDDKDEHDDEDEDD